MKHRLLTAAAVIMALVMALTMPLTAFAAAADNVTTLEEFLADESDQFTLGVDNNPYAHSVANFGATYEISDEKLQMLLNLEPSGLSQITIMSFVNGTAWGGSCYGVASTMVLNKLTKIGQTVENGDLFIELYKEGAENYSDLTDMSVSVADGNAMKDIINYYMVSQNLSAANDFWTWLVFGEELADAYAAAGRNVVDVQGYIDIIKAEVDAGRPAAIGYMYSGGGHAIVAFDYFEYDNGTPEDTADDIFYIKTYDMNALQVEGLPEITPQAGYIEFKKENGEYVASADYISLNNNFLLPYVDLLPEDMKHLAQWEAADGLNALMFFDMRNMTAHLNPENPQPFDVEINELTNVKIYDSNDFDGVLSVDVKSGDAIQQIALNMDESMGIVFPESVGVESEKLEDQFYNSFALDFGQKPDPEDPEKLVDTMDLNIELKDTAETFVINNTSDKTVAVDTSKAEGQYGGHFAGISASGFDFAGFDENAQLEYITAPEGGQIKDLSLFLADLANEENAADNIFLLSVPTATYLEVYNEADDPSYADSIVLHSDAFTSEDGYAFMFFEDGLQSDVFAGANTEENENWIKITAELKGEELFISIYTAIDKGDGALPVFPAMPGWTSEYDEVPEEGGWFRTAGGEWLYFVNDGESIYQLTGEQKLVGYQAGDTQGENEYLFDEQGYLVTGFVKTAEGWVYYGEEGTSPLTSTLGAKAVSKYVKAPAGGYRSATEIAAEKTYNYYFDENGIMYTGWHNDELTMGRWMYFGEQGWSPETSRLGRQARYGLVNAIGNGGETNKYFFSQTGTMMTGQLIIKGNPMTFNPDGADPAVDKLGAFVTLEGSWKLLASAVPEEQTALEQFTALGCWIGLEFGADGSLTYLLDVSDCILPEDEKTAMVEKFFAAAGAYELSYQMVSDTIVAVTMIGESEGSTQYLGYDVQDGVLTMGEYTLEWVG